MTEFSEAAAQLNAKGFEIIHHMLAGRIGGGLAQAQALAEAMDTILSETRELDRTLFVERVERFLDDWPEFKSDDVCSAFAMIFEENKSLFSDNTR